MEIETLETLHERAKHRKDGVYVHKDFYWVVKNNLFMIYSDLFGSTFKVEGTNSEYMGKLPECSIKRGLNQWLKSQQHDNDKRK